MCFTSKSFALAVILAFFSNTLFAQKTAGIYYFSFSVDKEIVTIDEKSSKKNGFLTGVSTSVDIPDRLIDSIKSLTERAFSQKLKATATCVYAKTKGGNTFETNSFSSGSEKMAVEGLPFALFNKAENQFKKDLYVQIQVLIEDGTGVRVDLGDGLSKIKPMITLKAKAYDQNKKEVWEQTTKVKNLGKLKRWAEDHPTYVRKGGQVLSAEMIVEMYRIALEAFLQESE